MTKKLFKAIFILVTIAMCFATVANAAEVVFEPTVTDAWYDNGVRYGRGIQLQCDEAGANKGNIYVTSEYFYYPGRYGFEHFPIFESTDGLKTWDYYSTIVEAGPLKMNNGTAIWEAFLTGENGVLYCFYSSEVGMTKGGGQRFVYRASSDCKTWGEDVKVCDFEEENPAFRPGMPVVTKMANGKFFMIYEGVNMGNGYMPVYYKITDDIESWRPTEREDGIMPKPFDCGSPYCTSLTDGTLVVGAHGTSKVAVNANGLKTDSWTIVDTNIGNAYTRCLVPLIDNKFMVVSAGAYSAPDPHKLSISIESIVLT